MSQNIVRHEPGAILSRAVEYNGMVFVAGLTADDYSLDIKGQTEQVLKKIDKYLAAAGTNKSRLLSTLIYISDINNKDKNRNDNRSNATGIGEGGEGGEGGDGGDVIINPGDTPAP